MCAWDLGVGIMSVIRLRTLLAADAEEAIARVWRVLEAHGIATPHMRVTHGSGIAIELSLASPEDAECVAKALRGETFVRVNQAS